MKLVKTACKLFFSTALALVIAGGVSSNAHAEVSTSIKLDRKAGICDYTVKGLETGKNHELTVTRSDNKEEVYKVTILDTDLSAEGDYSGMIDLADVKYIFTSYAINVDGVQQKICDFSIHKSKVSLSVSGLTGVKNRSIKMKYSEASTEVMAPGSENKVSIYCWYGSSEESTAKLVGSAQSLGGETMTWNGDVSKAGSKYGTWKAKAVLWNGHNNTTIATASYKVEPSATAISVKRSAAMEKKKSFQVVATGVQNVNGVKKLTFQMCNSKGQCVFTKDATKNTDGSYVATITMANLNNVLGDYTIKAVVTDNNNSMRNIVRTGKADQRARYEVYSVTAKNNATTVLKLTGVYVPGYAKKIVFVVKNSKGKTQGTYTATPNSDKTTYKAIIPSDKAGKYTAIAYAYTVWGKKVKMGSQSYTLSSSNLGKQGWKYASYAGKKYKFYYVNNKKSQDLTKVLGLKKNGNNKFEIEINRAACTVTVLMYDAKTKKYDIPVKVFAVSVGRDVSTNAGAGALNLKSSFTPIGNYSICSNGMATKYSLKPMHEPDGSTVYARWATHIVGNVYFHSIAVGSQSHNALNPNTFNRLGTPASAGCIRMQVADAKWIYDYCPSGTAVRIKKGNKSKPGPIGKPATIKIRSGSIHYDPTDPGISDARKKKDYKAKKISGYYKKNGTKVGVK